MSKLIDLTGKNFGRWTVLERASNDKNGQAHWMCQCACGREKIVYGNSLRSGHSRQCRHCGNKENTFKHGLSGTPLYNVLNDMIQRCENPNNKDYKHYGGRKIKICPEWREDFAVFAAWALANGYKEGLSIDRIDNDKGYFPENCQWITQSENSLKGWRIDGSHGKKYLKVS